MDDALTSLVLQYRKDGDILTVQTYFSANPGQIAGLIQLVRNQIPYPIEEYASWILTHLCKKQPHLFQPYYRDLVDILLKSSNHSVLRNVANVIHQLELENYKEGLLLNRLVDFIGDHKQKVALQVYSIYILILFVKKHPELRDELREHILFHQEGRSPAYQVATRNFLQAI